MSRASPLGLTRRLRLVGLVAGVFLVLLFLVDFAVPYTFLKMGIGTRYEIGTLRRGRAEYHKRFNIADEARTWRVGLIWARAGERLAIESVADVTDGSARLMVGRFPGVRPRLWGPDLSGRLALDTTLVFEETGFHQIRISKTGWKGRARVRWSVE